MLNHSENSTSIILSYNEVNIEFDIDMETMWISIFVFLLSSITSLIATEQAANSYIKEEKFYIRWGWLLVSSSSISIGKWTSFMISTTSLISSGIDLYYDTTLFFTPILITIFCDFISYYLMILTINTKSSFNRDYRLSASMNTTTPTQTTSLESHQNTSTTQSTISTTINISPNPTANLWTKHVTELESKTKMSKIQIFLIITSGIIFTIGTVAMHCIMLYGINVDMTRTFDTNIIIYLSFLVMSTSIFSLFFYFHLRLTKYRGDEVCGGGYTDNYQCCGFTLIVICRILLSIIITIAIQVFHFISLKTFQLTYNSDKISIGLSKSTISKISLFVATSTSFLILIIIIINMRFSRNQINNYLFETQRRNARTRNQIESLSFEKTQALLSINILKVSRCLNAGTSLKSSVREPPGNGAHRSSINNIEGLSPRSVLHHPLLAYYLEAYRDNNNKRESLRNGRDVQIDSGVLLPTIMDDAKIDAQYHITLEQIIDNPITLEIFKDEVLLSRSPENISFIIDVLLYERITDDQFRNKVLQYIIKVYFDPNSPNHINVSSEVVNKILLNHRTADTGYFNEVKTEVLNLIRRNDYTRFLTKSSYILCSHIIKVTSQK